MHSVGLAAPNHLRVMELSISDRCDREHVNPAFVCLITTDRAAPEAIRVHVHFQKLQFLYFIGARSTVGVLLRPRPVWCLVRLLVPLAPFLARLKAKATKRV